MKTVHKNKSTNYVNTSSPSMSTIKHNVAEKYEHVSSSKHSYTTTPSKQNLDFKSVSNPMAPLQSTSNQNIKNPFSPISNNNNNTFNNMNNTKQTNYNNMNIDFTSSNKPTQTTSNANNQYNFIGGVL